MAAKRLTYDEAIRAIKSNYPPENYTILRKALDMAIDVLGSADHQQAEIERLNRAYEVLERSLRHFSIGDVVVKRALAEAQRIKDGEQG